jgi:hypothetical protein
MSALDFTDAELLDWLEARTRKSATGISFDWVPSVEGEPSGFRFMRRHCIGDARMSLRAAIVAAMSEAEMRERIEAKGNAS